jgi:hypothetical protein
MPSTGHQLRLWTRDLVAASRDGWLASEPQVDVSFLTRLLHHGHAAAPAQGQPAPILAA